MWQVEKDTDGIIIIIFHSITGKKKCIIVKILFVDKKTTKTKT